MYASPAMMSTKQPVTTEAMMTVCVLSLESVDVDVVVGADVGDAVPEIADAVVAIAVAVALLARV